MTNRHTLNQSGANYARIYKEELAQLHSELPAKFKMRDAKEIVEDWDRGNFQKLLHAGLLENEYAGSSEPKDWYLTGQTKRWLENQSTDAD